MTQNTTYFGVNVTLQQREKLDRAAKKMKITRNALIRKLIDDLKEPE